MNRILTLNKISDAIYEYMKPEVFSVSDKEADPEGILVRSMDCLEREFNPSLLAFARAGAGTNNIPIDRCTKAGIAVFNTPGANANAVKELALCCMLMSTRNVVEGIQWASSLTGADVPKQVESGKKQFVGHELNKKTLGVIGLGAIGVMVANDAHAIGMNVIGYDPFISVQHAWGLSRAIVHAESLAEMLPQCDYVTIHVPLMDKTRNYIDEAVLSYFKPGSVLLNLARGELVNTQAVLAALKDKKLSRYITDFPNGDLIGQENVVCIPHLGASTEESEENCALFAAKELSDYLLHGNIENSVNMPACSMAVSGVCRVCAIHDNVKNMVGQITAVLADANCNIANMVNKSRGDIAYTMLDLDSEISEAEVERISAIPGMLRVRVINH